MPFDPAGLDGRLIRVTDKTEPPPGGTLRDFRSAGPYWWPDPDSPDGLPYIRRDGQVNPEARGGVNDDSERVQQLARAFETLAGRLGGEESGADLRARAAELLRAFFLDPQTGMLPSLPYAQAIPGHCAGRGIGIIDTVPFVRLLDAYDRLRRDAPVLAPDEHAALRAWFRRYLDWLLSHENGIAERNAHNNHGSWMDAQLVRYALFCGDPDLALDILRDVPRRRIDAQIAPNGAQPFELERTRSFGYSIFNLTALVTLARLGAPLGVDLWNYTSPSGGSIRKAADFLRPYVDAAVEWPFAEIDAQSGQRVPCARSQRQRLLPLLAEIPAPRETVLRDIPYAPDLGHWGLGDLHIPHDAGPSTPVMLTIHGGGWANCNRHTWEGATNFFCRSLGFAVFSVEYRLVGGDRPYRWPDGGEDCIRAAQFLLSDAFRARFNLDNRRIVLSGGSSGGHLALWAGLSLPRNQVRAIVSVSGVAVPGMDAERHPNRYVPLFGHAATADDLRSMDPSTLLAKNSPPILLTHATDDPTVPFAVAQRFAASAAECGARCSLFSYTPEVVSSPPSACPVSAAQAAEIKAEPGHHIWLAGQRYRHFLPCLEKEMAAFLAANP